MPRPSAIRYSTRHPPRRPNRARGAQQPEPAAAPVADGGLADWWWDHRPYYRGYRRHLVFDAEAAPDGQGLARRGLGAGEPRFSTGYDTSATGCVLALQLR